MRPSGVRICAGWHRSAVACQTEHAQSREKRRRQEVILPQRRAAREQHRRGDLSEQWGVIQDEMKVGSIHSTFSLKQIKYTTQLPI